MDTLRSIVLQSEELDFVEITEIIQTLHWYWELLLGNLEYIPDFKRFLVIMDKHYPGGFIAGNTPLVQYLLLVLLVLKQHFPVKEFIQSEQAKTIFSLMIHQMRSAQSTPYKGGEQE